MAFRKDLIARGAVAGAVGALLFFGVHHVVIQPIWFAAPFGVAFAALVGWGVAAVRERAGVGALRLAAPLLAVLVGFALAGLVLREEGAPLAAAALVALGFAGAYAGVLAALSPRGRPSTPRERGTAGLVLLAAAPSLVHAALFTVTSLAEGSRVDLTLTMTSTIGAGFLLAGALLDLRPSR